MLLNFLRKLVLYFHDIYRQSGQNQANTRSSVKKILYLLDFDQIVYIYHENIEDKFPENTYSDQKNLSYLIPIVWNSLPTDLKLVNSLNNFTHKLKDHFFKKLRNTEQNVFAY